VIPEIISKKGRGLMLGVEFDLTQALRKKWLLKTHFHRWS
jgi:4-aminobutyrate aminotransferase-like enzyme